MDHQPFRIRKGAHDQVEKHTRHLVLYAAAIGAKRGALPLNLAGVRATISERKSDCATVLFDRQNDPAADSRPVWVRVGQVTIENLDAWPSEPWRAMSQRRHDPRAAMSKRHADALAIAAGACNPSGIAYSIIDACQEIRSEPDYKSRGTIAITSDPAVRLMVYQLAFVCGADSRMDALGVYDDLIKGCQRQAQHPDPCSSRAPWRSPSPKLPSMSRRC